MKVIDPRVKFYVGIVKGSAVVESIISYDIFIEGVHSVDGNPMMRAKGVPIFAYGYNSIRYANGTRVALLAKGEDLSEVFVLGELPNPLGKKTPTPSEGEIGKKINLEDRSGITPLGKKDNMVLWAGKSALKIDSGALTFTYDKKSVFNVNSSALSIGDGVSFNYSFSEKNMRVANREGFYFNSSEGPLWSSTNGWKIVSNGAPGFLSSPTMSLSGKNLNAEFGSVKISSLVNTDGPKDSIVLKTLKGNISNSIGTGDYKIAIVDFATSKISFDLGYPIKFARVTLDKNGVEIQGGTSPASSVIKINSDGTVKIDSFSDISISSKGGDISIKSTGGDVDVESKIGDVTLTTSSAGKIVLDGDVEVTGDLDTDGEVTAKKKSTSVKLSTHKHSSAAPGAPSPPISGT